MKRSERRILTTHTGRLPNPPNMREILAARANDPARLGQDAVRGRRRRVGEPTALAERQLSSAKPLRPPQGDRWRRHRLDIPLAEARIGRLMVWRRTLQCRSEAMRDEPDAISYRLSSASEKFRTVEGLLILT